MSSHHGAGDRWLAGEPVPGVEFALHEQVEIRVGPHDGSRGLIVLLIALVPEPSYLVRIDGREVRARQSQLRAVPS